MAVTQTNQGRGPFGIPEPYGTAYYMLHHAGPADLERFVVRGMDVEYRNPMDGAYQHRRLDVRDVIERVRGYNLDASHYEIMYRVRQAQDMAERRPRSITDLPVELRYAYEAMRHANRRELQQYAHEGIPVQRYPGRPTALPAPETEMLSEMVEYRIDYIQPAAVFMEMQRIGIPIEPVLGMFAYEVCGIRVPSRPPNTNDWTSTYYNNRIPVDAATRESVVGIATTSTAGSGQTWVTVPSNDWANFPAVWQYRLVPESPEVAAEREACQARAVALLERVVTAAEFECYKVNKRIEVRGKKWEYWIQKGQQTRLFDKKTMTVEWSSCLQFDRGQPANMPPPAGGPPSEDRMVAEYLLIKNDEKRYLETANLFPVSERAGQQEMGRGNGAIQAQYEQQTGLQRGATVRSLMDVMRQYQDRFNQIASMQADHSSVRIPEGV